MFCCTPNSDRIKQLRGQQAYGNMKFIKYLQMSEWKLHLMPSRQLYLQSAVPRPKLQSLFLEVHQRQSL